MDGGEQGWVVVTSKKEKKERKKGKEADEPLETKETHPEVPGDVPVEEVVADAKKGSKKRNKSKKVKADANEPQESQDSKPTNNKKKKAEKSSKENKEATATTTAPKALPVTTTTPSTPAEASPKTEIVAPTRPPEMSRKKKRAGPKKAEAATTEKGAKAVRPPRTHKAGGGSALKAFLRWMTATAFVVAGVNHVMESDFLPPNVVPFLGVHTKSFVLTTAALEILLGTLLFLSSTAGPAAWGLVMVILAWIPFDVRFLVDGMAQLKADMSPSTANMRVGMDVALSLWTFWFTGKN